MIELINKRTIAIDDTLTKKGYAADAAAIGEAIRGLEFPEDFNINDYYVKDEVNNEINVAVGELATEVSTLETDLDEAFNNIGEALGNRYTKAETDKAIEDAVKDIDIPTEDLDLTDYYTKSETDAAIKSAVDAVDIPEAINGKDGVSCTHSWSGTTLTITSASGTSSANLKGEQGIQGVKGEDGYTPVKGTDYYTAADKEEMVNAVIAALPVYNGEVV